MSSSATTRGRTRDIPYGDLVRSDRVHASVYTDPEIFEDELERIWYSTWVYVGHESEIRHPGDYVTRTIGRQPVILSRDGDQARVLLNRCPHRGNTVCQYERGNSRSFRCAYHAWTFDNGGRLVGATLRSGFGPEFEQSDLDMARLPRVASYRGFVFASFSPDGPSLEEHLGNARSYIDRFVDLAPEGEVDLNAGSLRTRFGANWKMPLENAVDGYHPIFLHRSVFRAYTKEGVSLSSVYGEGSSVVTRDLGNGHAMLDFTLQNRQSGMLIDPASIPDADQKQYREALANRVGDERADELLADGLSNVSIFPNLILAFQDVRVAIPLAPNETVLSQTPALLRGAPPSINRHRLRTQVRWWGPSGFMNPDDIEVFERNQRAFEARINEWVVLIRGQHRERTQPDGTLVSEASDETSQRAIWKRYLELMRP